VGSPASCACKLGKEAVVETFHCSPVLA